MNHARRKSRYEKLRVMAEQSPFEAERQAAVRAMQRMDADVIFAADAAMRNAVTVMYFGVVVTKESVVRFTCA